MEISIFLLPVHVYIFLGNFPRFSVHKSSNILEKYVTNFFKGYINYLRANQMSSPVHLITWPSFEEEIG